MWHVCSQLHPERRRQLGSSVKQHILYPASMQELEEAACTAGESIKAEYSMYIYLYLYIFTIGTTCKEMTIINYTLLQNVNFQLCSGQEMVGNKSLITYHHLHSYLLMNLLS